MKITHSASGKSYHLLPDTRLEIERPNLFFNEYGEQSLPIDLPDTDHNRALMSYPDLLTNCDKPSAGIRCTIQDGNYHMPCRQAILGAKRKEKITTSFFMNEGSFLSRISDVSLTEIFDDEVIPGIETVQQGIDFCWSLRDNSHPHFAIFPICVELDGERRFVNRINNLKHPDAIGKGISTGNTSYNDRFFNAVEQKEMVDGRVIKLEPGYYISPFIRAVYLLRRIFSYFGYTLLDHFLTTTEPFSKMVFVNNTIDSLVNGSIMLSHLVPDCMCNTILDVYRRKFCCEFIPDEVSRTVRIVLFNEIMDSKPSMDLTPYLTSQPDISYPEYRQIKLSSEEFLSESKSFDSVFEIESKYPEAWYNPSDGSYCRSGYTYRTVHEVISDGNIPYHSGGVLKAYEVNVPDCVFCQTYLEYPKPIGSITHPWGSDSKGETVPYIGEGRTLNSTIDGLPTTDISEEETPGDESLASDTPKQKPILALVHTNSAYSLGVNHDPNGEWGYSLQYNGPSGIYEKFYRRFDNLLRNSLHKVSVDLLLPDHVKSSLQVHSKICLQGEELIFNILKYTIGGENNPVASELFTTSLYNPLSLAKPEAERMIRNTDYKWVVESQETEISESMYIAAGYPSTGVTHSHSDIPAIYPLPPTKAMCDSGDTYYPRTYYLCYYDRQNRKIFSRLDLSLRPVQFSDPD